MNSVVLKPRSTRNRVTVFDENSFYALEIEQRKNYSTEMLAVEYMDIMGVNLGEDELDEEDDFLDGLF